MCNSNQLKVKFRDNADVDEQLDSLVDGNQTIIFSLRGFAMKSMMVLGCFIQCFFHTETAVGQ